jgi:hypothetical protein
VGTTVPGIDAGWKADHFGRRKIKRVVDGQPETHVIAYDPQDEASRLWDARGAATGAWPAIAGFRQYENTREYWIFVDGWILFRPDGHQPFRVLKADAAGGAVAGIDAGWKRDRFGKKTATRVVAGVEKTFTIRYNPDGEVSRLWETRGATEGTWPRFSEYRQDAGGREYWRFRGGWTVWRPNPEAPVRVLKAQ